MGIGAYFLTYSERVISQANVLLPCVVVDKGGMKL